jgi:hypothetical protein
MPALDFILPAANLASPRDGGMAPPPSGDRPSDEPFDQVMTRALSPSEMNAPSAPDSMGAASTDPNEGQPNTISPPPRRRIQSRNAAPEKTPAAAGKTGDPAVQSQDHKSRVVISESDAGKNKGNNVTVNGTPAQNDIPAVPAMVPAISLPGIVIQLVTAVPTGALPTSLPMLEKKDASDGKIVPATAAVSTAGVTAGSDPIETLAGGAKTKTDSSSAETTPNPAISPDKNDAKLISSLKPGGPQKNTVKADDPVAGKINPNSSQPAALPADTSKTSESAVHLAKNEPPPPVDPGLETMTSAPLESRGITAAKLYLPMKKTEKVNEVAGLTGKNEKVLPGNADSTAPEKNLPTVDPVARISPRNGPAMVIIGPPTKGPEPAAASAAEGVSASAAVDVRSRALERTHDMIAVQATRLVDSNLDSLRVVIKPGAGMQLSLEMRQRGDAIEAQVVLQRGDFGHLNQHWPELQQRLEQRGVRLAPLTGSENSTTNPDLNGFQQPKREFTNPDPLMASAFAEFALAGPSIQPPTPAMAPIVIHHGWETWA